MKPFFTDTTSKADSTKHPATPVVPPVPPLAAHPTLEPAGAGAEAPPIRVMTELDSYIAERVRSQPSSLAEVEERASMTVREDAPHRLALPEVLEVFAYDCSQGVTCAVHAWSKTTTARGTLQWLPTKHGPYVFRWQNKHKRSLDAAINVYGWSIVSRVYFPSVPRRFFSATGGVEEGDALLLFMPVKKALALRAAPGHRSRDLLAGRLTSLKGGQKVLMTGDPDNERYYIPDFGMEEDGTEAVPAGGLQYQEGRDFNVAKE